MRKPRRRNYQYPGVAEDKLFTASYRHRHRAPWPCGFCAGDADSFCQDVAEMTCAEPKCDEVQLVLRERLKLKPVWR